MSEKFKFMGYSPLPEDVLENIGWEIIKLPKMTANTWDTLVEDFGGSDEIKVVSLQYDEENMMLAQVMISPRAQERVKEFIA